MVSAYALSRYSRVQEWSRPSVAEVREDAPTGNPAINVTLPESGVGYATYNREPDGVDQVGVADFITYIQDLGKEWNKTHSLPFQVGDISQKGGGPFPPHEAHQGGTECDIRPFRLDGAMEPCQWTNQQYDRDTTREWIKTVKATAPRAKVLFNDPQLIKEGLCQRYKGHDNHLHLGWKPNSLNQEGGC